MIRKTIIVALTLGTLSWGWLWILGASAEGHELHDLARWERFDLEVSYAAGYAILARHLPEPSAFELVEQADGRVSEIELRLGFEHGYTGPLVEPSDFEPIRLGSVQVDCRTGRVFFRLFRTVPMLDIQVSEHLQEIWVVPWLPFLLCALYPTWAFARGHVRRRHRRKRGLCLRCGYDLTGNVSGVCSECGVPLRPGPQERSIR